MSLFHTTKGDISKNYVWDHPWIIRHQPGFLARPIKSPCYGTEPLDCLGPEIFELVPVQLKNANP